MQRMCVYMFACLWREKEKGRGGHTEFKRERYEQKETFHIFKSRSENTPWPDYQTSRKLLKSLFSQAKGNIPINESNSAILFNR